MFCKFDSMCYIVFDVLIKNLEGLSTLDSNMTKGKVISHI